MKNCVAWKPKSSDPSIASVRYRCLLPLDDMKSKGFNVELFCEENVEKYSAVIFSKLYDPKNQELARRLQAKSVTVILDLCDNHFYNPFNLDSYKVAKENLLQMLHIADKVVCSTVALAEIVKNDACLKVMPVVIGDPIEPLPLGNSKLIINDWFNKLFHIKKISDDLPYLLWYGSHGAPNAPSGMSDILSIKHVLNKIYKEYPFELVVASNNKKKYHEVIEPMLIPSRYVEWDYSQFKSLLQSARGVIIPITINPFTLCKTNNRLAMALSNEIPVVADSIPSYVEFGSYCYLDDWENGLKNILGNHKSAQNRAKLGGKYIMENWTLNKITDQWEKFLKSYLSVNLIV